MANLQPTGKQQYFNSAGAPLVGGKLFTYAAGTSTLKATYADAAGTQPNTNPVILDARGEALIYWSGNYKVQLQDATGSVLWTVDNVGTQIDLSSLSVTGPVSISGPTTLAAVTATGAASLQSVAATSVTTPSITAPAGQSLSLGANGTPLTTLSTAGNLGLNTLPIDGYGQSVQLRNGGAAISALLMQTINATAQPLYLTNNLMPPAGAFTGTFNYTFTGAAGSMYQQAAGVHSWASAPAGTAGATASASVNMTLDASGNLGLGVTPSVWGPGYKTFEVNGASLSGANLVTLSLAQNAYNNGTNWIYRASLPASMHQQNSGIHYWFTAPSGTAGNPVTFSQAMTLSSSRLQSLVPINFPGYTVATLPSGVIGDRAYVTDATSASFLAPVTGGGTVKTPVFFNGTAWVAG